MSYRFYSEEPIRYETAGGTIARLSDSEAHHFLHVMRGGVGDRVTLFDGSGYEFEAEVTQTTRRDVTLAVLSQTEVDREPAIAVSLGVALPKGDRQKVLVDMLTQLGVARLVPLATEHSVAAPKGSGLDKLRRSVIEASKQCGRNRLMAIDEPMGLDEFLTTTQADVRLIAHPTGGASAIEKAGKSVAIAIGPEGGFADAEVATAAAAGWEAVSFGRSILRIETAAIAAASLYSITKIKK
jgi:16S rRNA (uracil1498-N3)-methyltransferase